MSPSQLKVEFGNWVVQSCAAAMVLSSHSPGWARCQAIAPTMLLDVASPNGPGPAPKAPLDDSERLESGGGAPLIWCMGGEATKGEPAIEIGMLP